MSPKPQSTRRLVVARSNVELRRDRCPQVCSDSRRPDERRRLCLQRLAAQHRGRRRYTGEILAYPSPQQAAHRRNQDSQPWSNVKVVKVPKAASGAAFMWAARGPSALLAAYPRLVCGVIRRTIDIDRIALDCERKAAHVFLTYALHPSLCIDQLSAIDRAGTIGAPRLALVKLTEYRIVAMSSKASRHPRSSL